MQRKQSRQKSKPKKQVKAEQKCSMCKNKISVGLNMKQALYRKYSSSQNHFYLKTIDKMIPKSIEPEQEYLQKYQKGANRKYVFNRVKQIYKNHQQIPRIFQLKIKQILDKCHHRKRLIEYFKMAKLFNLPVQSVKFSTFLLSLSYAVKEGNHAKFQPLIDKISKYDFSEQIQKGLLETMDQPKKANLNPELVL